MNKKITFIVFFLLSLPLFSAEQDLNRYTSSYTSIDEKDCISLDSDDIGSIEECEPFGNISVKVIEGDFRQSIVLTRNMQEYILDFQSTISYAFSYLGEKIEWRHEVGKPEHIKGMIVRLNVNSDFEDLDKTTSFLVVSKITPKKICVIGKILPQENQNEVAIAMLDDSKDRPCIKVKKS